VGRGPLLAAVTFVLRRGNYLYISSLHSLHRVHAVFTASKTTLTVSNPPPPDPGTPEVSGPEGIFYKSIVLEGVQNSDMEHPPGGQ
jgi:hypothetical protein